METIVGFVAGYLVGTSAGKAGLKRLQESWPASSTSPHVRKMAADAPSANPALSPGSRAR